MEQITVSRRALLQRINRRLAKDGEVLRAARSKLSRHVVGEFYVVDTAMNGVVEKGVDPVAKARGMGVLAAYESVVEP
jgi:hypothetical protein